MNCQWAVFDGFEQHDRGCGRTGTVAAGDLHLCAQHYRSFARAAMFWLGDEAEIAYVFDALDAIRRRAASDPRIQQAIDAASDHTLADRLESVWSAA